MSENLRNEFSQDLKDRAAYLRHSFVESLETHLLALESKLIDHQINVRWAQDEDNLCSSIIDLLPQKQYNRVCFDLPVIPRTLTDAGNVMNVSSIDSIADHENEVDTLVVQADFAIAENGSLVFIDKPSKDCFNKVNNVIVIVNIDQIIVSQSDLTLFLKLKNQCDEDFPRDVKILNSSYDKLEADLFCTSDSSGFSRQGVTVSVILYENNVSNILQDTSLRQSLYCINCGRCAKVCPVLKSSNSVSPIELIKNNCFDQYNRTQSIFYQTTLCGNCQEVCPVGIKHIDLLVYEMNLVNSNSNYVKGKNLLSIFSKRSKMNKFNSPFFRFFFIRRFFGKNRILYNYFNSQKTQFFNITRSIPEKEDDIL